MQERYTVIKGDTLSRIGQRLGVDWGEIAKANHIKPPYTIVPGQALIIPRPAKTSTASTDEAGSELWIRFVDAIGEAIQGLKTRLVAGGESFEGLTDGGGRLSPLAVAGSHQTVQVHVAKVGGGEKKIAEIPLTPGKQRVVLRSPKIKLHTRLMRHEGEKQPKPKTEAKPLGYQDMRRNENGHPVHEISVECPNPDNLRLGPNFEYHDAILAAARRSGLQPQAIAAVIDAEAAKIKGLKWNPRSSTTKSSARGMTQFLANTWVSEALRPGIYLNEQAMTRHYVTKQGGLMLANGKTLAPTEAQKNIRSQSKFKKLAKDANVQALLDLRYEPEFAIMAAVDYGVHNLRALEQAGFKLDGLNDGEKAKFLYLTHHLGLADAKRFIQGTIPEEDVLNERGRVVRFGARTLLEAQVGGKRAARFSRDNDGSYVLGHREWLGNYVDTNMDIKKHSCKPNISQSVRDLLSLVVVVAENNRK